MIVSKETELGKISVSSVFYAEIIKNCFLNENCINKIWPSSAKGKQIGSDSKINVNDIASHVHFQTSENGDIIGIELCVIVKFGTSIKKITQALSDLIANDICEFNGKKPETIHITINGVKSKALAKRNMEVTFEYEA